MKAHVEQILSPEKHSFLGRRFTLEAFDHPFHFHPELELTYILRSSGTRVIGDHVGTFEEGDLCLIGENLPHVYRNTLKPQNGAHSEVLHFARDCANGFLDIAPELRAFSDMMDDARSGLCFDRATAATALELMIRIREAEGVQRWRLFLELIECLIDAPQPEKLASAGYTGVTSLDVSARMHQACQYILEHFDEELSHEKLAEVTHTSPAYFSRLFKKTTRKTYTEFLTEVRLGHACRLLVESDLPIVDIAFNSGYRNLSSFNRSFLKVYACSPRDYRKRYAG